LARRGAAVAVLCRSRIKEAREVAEQIESAAGRALAIDADVLDPEAIKRSAREAAAKLGSIDILRECIPSMKERRWGRIINVSSQVVYTGSNNHAHYSAAKSGLLGFTFSLTKELGPFGITANVVAPGRIVTDLLTERMAGREKEWMTQTPMRRFGQPEEVASAIAFLASEGASYITGAVINVNGGLVMG
jgi:3-oxoacyl-[acyl-carrier protein] reductase